MIKYKAKIKNCQLLVRAKLSSELVVNPTELDFFSRKYLRGFLKPVQLKRNKLEYTGPVGVPLSERLKKPICKYDFFFLIEQIVDATQKLQRNQFLWNKVVWDIQKVYINETTKETQLIFLPIKNTLPPVDLMTFLESIIYAVHPVDNNDSAFVSRFVYFLKGLPCYDAQKIEAYIMREDRSVVNTIKKHGTNGSGFMTNKPKDYYAHYAEKLSFDDDATGLLSDDDEPTGILTETDEATGLLQENEKATDVLKETDEATGLLNDDDEATGLLIDAGSNEWGYSQKFETRFPTLYRVLTGEKITINKPVFRLGKERSYVDYFVTNNNAVSRSHADIVTRNDCYYVVDLNSKNRTYINGQALPVHCECEIFDGNLLTLGNEEFVFNT